MTKIQKLYRFGRIKRAIKYTLMLIALYISICAYINLMVKVNKIDTQLVEITETINDKECVF